MGRQTRCSEHAGLTRGAWTAQEDMLLTQAIRIHGEGGWTSIPQRAGLKRCGKSCRLRWLNYLRPHIKRGNISSDEEELIVRLHGLLGNRWSLIAGRLPGRTDNEIKNYWNTRFGKKSLPNKKLAPKPETKVKHTSPAVDGLLKVIPVKAKAVRIAKGWNKYVGSGSSNHQATDPAQTVKTSNTDGPDLSLYDLKTDHNSNLNDCRMPAQLGSPSVEMNGQYCHEDFRIDELVASPSHYWEMSSLYNNMEEIDFFSDAVIHKMEGICDSKKNSDWVGELQYLQM